MSNILNIQSDRGFSSGHSQLSSYRSCQHSALSDYVMSYFSEHLANVININISYLNHPTAYTEEFCWLNNISHRIYQNNNTQFLFKEDKR